MQTPERERSKHLCEEMGGHKQTHPSPLGGRVGTPHSAVGKGQKEGCREERGGALPPRTPSMPLSSGPWGSAGVAFCEPVGAVRGSRNWKGAVRVAQGPRPRVQREAGSSTQSKARAGPEPSLPRGLTMASSPPQDPSPQSHAVCVQPAMATTRQSRGLGVKEEPQPVSEPEHWSRESRASAPPSWSPTHSWDADLSGHMGRGPWPLLYRPGVLT